MWKGFAIVIGATVVALVVTAIAALILVAGGHGWSGASVSATSLLSGPAGAAAWLLRRSRTGLWIAAAAIVINLAADVILIAGTARQGWGPLAEFWDHLPLVLILWASLWLALQAIPVAALRRS